MREAGSNGGIAPPAATAGRRPASVMIAAHAHPALSKGGAEIAAWRQFEGFRALPDWRAWFMGCTAGAGGGRLGSHITQPFSDDEFLYAVAGVDWFKFSNADPRFPRELETVLRQTAPDVLHFHHYANYGVETFLIARRTLPDCRIVLTLHEFQAICNHYGQMVTRPDKTLCYESSPRNCNKCFPEISRSDFFLRRAYIRRFFDLVDAFVSPSQFLADRYVAWGVPAEKSTVIENVIAAGAGITPVDKPRTDVFHVGFFGQISFLKGFKVLLDAARILDEEKVTDIVFDIHGDYTGQPVEFQTEFLTHLGKAGRNVRFHGPYDNKQVDGLMRAADVVLVPSIWWENSPIVIQECLRNRCPIVCSNIGGMAEKVRPGLDGFHFNVGDALALRSLLRSLSDNRDTVAAVRETMRYPELPADAVGHHVALYDRLFRAAT
jgi:glycosyltransferase involved in cell wall biosynthesis